MGPPHWNMKMFVLFLIFIAFASQTSSTSGSPVFNNEVSMRHDNILTGGNLLTVRGIIVSDSNAAPSHSKKILLQKECKRRVVAGNDKQRGTLTTIITQRGDQFCRVKTLSTNQQSLCDNLFLNRFSLFFFGKNWNI